MVKILVDNSKVMFESEGRPLDVIGELVNGTINALEQITKDCPDDHFKKCMLKAFTDTIETVLL